MAQVVSRCLNNEGLKPERTPEMMTALKFRVLADSIFEKPHRDVQSTNEEKGITTASFSAEA